MDGQIQEPCLDSHLIEKLVIASRDVADKLDISPSSVYLKLRTATKMLHAILIGQGETK